MQAMPFGRLCMGGCGVVCGEVKMVGKELWSV